MNQAHGASGKPPDLDDCVRAATSLHAQLRAYAAQEGGDAAVRTRVEDLADELDDIVFRLAGAAARRRP